MRDRLRFALYVAAIVAFTLIHDVALLLAATAALALLAGRDFPRIARRTLVAIPLFNAVVTLAYAALTLRDGTFSALYLVRTNLRVFLLTATTFLACERIDPFRLLGSAGPLPFFFVVAYGQIGALRRRLASFRLALRSRSIRRPRVRDLYRHRAAAAASLIESSMHDAGEVAWAMRARGAFLDPD